MSGFVEEHNITRVYGTQFVEIKVEKFVTFNKKNTKIINYYTQKSNSIGFNMYRLLG